jgi:uncharacterized protein YcfL
MKKILLIGCLILVSCKKDAQDKVVVEKPIDLAVTAARKHNNKLKDLVDQFIKNTEIISKSLKSLQPEEANKLFDEYEKKNNELVAEMNKVEETIINDYYFYFYDDNGNPKQVVDSLRQKQELLRKAHLEFWEVGEGMAEIRPVHDFYLNIFKEYVTIDYKEFLELQSADDSKLWAGDAAIGIPWPELGMRVINWENFLKKYGNSKLADRAELYYSQYQYSYLFGMDNTSTYEYNDVNLYPETVIEFKRFVAKYPDSPTAKLAQQMLDSNGKGFEHLREVLQKEHEEIYKKFYNE